MAIRILKKKELKITAENRIGMLAEITGLIAEKEVNIENICAYAANEKAIFYLITDDNEKVKRAIEGKGFQIEEKEVMVLFLWNRPGALSEVAKKFKEEGIDIQHVYGTSSEKEERTTIVFSTDDIDKVLEVFGFMIVQ